MTENNYPCCKVKCEKCQRPSCQCYCDRKPAFGVFEFAVSGYHCAYGTALSSDRNTPLWLPKPKDPK
jgi:hypothetical protein